MSKAALVRTITDQITELNRQYHELSMQSTAVHVRRNAARDELMAGVDRMDAVAYWQRVAEIRPVLAAIGADELAELEAGMASLREQAAKLTDEKKALRAPRQTWGKRAGVETAWSRDGRYIAGRRA